jgi:HAD superfamily hydrolase (TIGR01549 family)
MPAKLRKPKQALQGEALAHSPGFEGFRHLLRPDEREEVIGRAKSAHPTGKLRERCIARDVKAIIFDGDDTLLPFIPMKVAGVRAAARAMVEKGLRMEPEEAARELFAFYAENGSRDPNAVSGIDGDAAFGRFILHKTRRGDPEMLCAAIRAYVSAKRGFGAYAHVPETLAALKERGYRLGLLSNAPREKLLGRLENAGLSQYLDAVVSAADDLHAPKPDKKAFQSMAGLLGVPPENVLVVGDALYSDIHGANGAGMFSCLAAWGVAWKEEKSGQPDLVIRDIRGILGVLGCTRRKLGNGKGQGPGAGG